MYILLKTCPNTFYHKVKKYLLRSRNPSNTFTNEFVEHITIPIRYVTYKYALKFVFKIVSVKLKNTRLKKNEMFTVFRINL